MNRRDYLNNLEVLNLKTLKEIGGTRVILNDKSQILPITSKKVLDDCIIYSENKSKGIKDTLNWDKKLVNQKELQFVKSVKLRDLLLSFGGNEACILEPEEDIDNILEYGQFWFGKNSKMMKGLPNQCHSNSCRLWKSSDNKTHSRICTGYALSKDGIWRQHSWVLNLKANSNQIIETTIPRIAYFGFIMDENCCEEFCYNNL